MSDNYQAVYDAVRRAFPHCDTSRAISEALDFSWMKQIIQQEFMIVLGEYQRPCIIWKAELSQCSQGKWTTNFGPIYGHGDSPAEAMADFDKKWYKKND